METILRGGGVGEGRRRSWGYGQTVSESLDCPESPQDVITRLKLKKENGQGKASGLRYSEKRKETQDLHRRRLYDA